MFKHPVERAGIYARGEALTTAASTTAWRRLSVCRIRSRVCRRTRSLARPNLLDCLRQTVGDRIARSGMAGLLNGEVSFFKVGHDQRGCPAIDVIVTSTGKFIVFGRHGVEFIIGHAADVDLSCRYLVLVDVQGTLGVEA